MIFLVNKTCLTVTTNDFAQILQLFASNIDRAKAKLRHSMIDQEYLLYKIEEWKTDDQIFPYFTELKRKNKWKWRMGQIHFFLCVSQSDKSISFNVMAMN